MNYKICSTMWICVVGAWTEHIAFISTGIQQGILTYSSFSMTMEMDIGIFSYFFFNEMVIWY